MAPSHFLVPGFGLILLATLALPLPTCTATEFVVGDDIGWTIGFDYQAWSTGKEFRIGDTLVFKYPEGAHNVYKVNATGFQSCTPPVESIPLTSGNDKVILTTLGPKWYICGVDEHCDIGNQKLAITVKPQTVAASPSPAQSMNSYYSNNVEKLGRFGTMTVAFVGAVVTVFVF